ncbi:Peptide-N4-(N-acetyl-beta-glucosaminyl)asparagine amidase A [Hibiscus syriacus]|uniref:Peptide-N4-(N-acetyl-beta-glucosaminyl)asparagine amidase A n=1 Tax=Hibiscus syriacus TaxID=106335 RepID=A0A6A2YP55_HIBSY|nr:Peptide-N4-(N-acetyl-beta-glucosaminyl)asparagine amidase A [Hibiscus syriacus]
MLQSPRLKTEEHMTIKGNGPFREVLVSLEGEVVGSVWPFTVVYTGGINPPFWRPISGIGSFDLPSYDIEISPFLGNLLDGKMYELSFSVTNALNVWYVDANLHLWLDSKSAKTEGNLLQHVVPLDVSSVLDFKGLNGTFITNTTRFVLDRIGQVHLRDDHDRVRSRFKVPHILIHRRRRWGERDSVDGNQCHIGNQREDVQRCRCQVAYQFVDGVIVVKDNLVISGVGSTQQSYDYNGNKFCYSRNISSSNYTNVDDEV